MPWLYSRAWLDSRYGRCRWQEGWACQCASCNAGAMWRVRVGKLGSSSTVFGVVCRIRRGIMVVRADPDRRAELPEFLLDVLITAVDMIDAAHLGGAFGGQAGEHQAGR